MIKPLLDLAKKHAWLFETDDRTFDLFSRSGRLCHGSKACGNISEVNPPGDLQKKGRLLDTPTRSLFCHRRLWSYRQHQ